MRKFAAFLLLTLIATGAFAEKVAVISKAKGDVLLRKADTPDYHQSVTMGTLLENNDQIKVNDGFAVMLLLDDQSQFKLLENTEVAITMVEDLSGAAYHIRLDYGQTLTNYSTVAGSGFYIHTPTSVVSVKGTSFWTISDPETGDNVIVLDGVVDVVNNLTGETSTALAGQSVRSTPDGNIRSAPTVEGSIPQDPEDSSEVIEPEPESPEDSVEVVEEKHSKRNLGLIIGFVMVILFAVIL